MLQEQSVHTFTIRARRHHMRASTKACALVHNAPGNPISAVALGCQPKLARTSATSAACNIRSQEMVARASSEQENHESADNDQIGKNNVIPNEA